MRDIAIIGAGGLGKEVATTLIMNNKANPEWNLVGFFDDVKAVGTPVSHYGNVLGGVDAVNQWDKPLSVVIAIGSPNALMRVRQRIANPMVSFPNIILGKLGCADRQTFQMGEGNIIQGACWFSCDVKIGSFNVLNGSVELGHDAEMGDYNVLMPDVRVSGGVHIGNVNLLGVGSIVIQGLTIGDGVRLGAGAVLLTNPRNGGLYVGNPAKLFKY